MTSRGTSVWAKGQGPAQSRLQIAGGLMCEAISVKPFEPRHWRVRVMCAGAAPPNCFPRVSPGDCVGRSGIRRLTTRDYGKTFKGARRRRTCRQGGEEERAGTSLRPTFRGGEIQLLLCKKLRKTAFASDVRRCRD